MPSKKNKTPTVMDTGNVYDRIFKEVMEDLALTILGRFHNLRITTLQRLPEKMHTTTQREADFLCEVTDEHGNKFLLHIEFQSSHDRNMLARMQEYHGILARKYKLAIRHFVFYFGDEPGQMPSQLDPEMVFTGFELVDFKTIDYRQLLDSDTGKEVVLTILADFNNTPADAVIRLIISKLRQVSHSEQELKRSLNQLTILSRLRKLEAETIQTASAMPITIDIKQDYLYNKGLEEGKLEGILEGKLEGKLEGEAKGKLEAKMVTMIETDLELLCRMAKENVSYDLMQRLSDVPEPFLAAFRSAWSADKARTLLALVAQTRERSGVDNIRQQLMDALVAFGIPQEASKSYLKGII
jgi:predicted transposase YdaD